MNPRRIVVHGLAHALAAAEAAASLGVPVTIVSAPGAAGYAGPLWFAAVIAAARSRFPAAEIGAVLDCGADAGRALAALRAGATRIGLRAPPRVAAKIASIARASGAKIERARSRALDLGQVGDIRAAARLWLAKGQLMDC